MAQIKRFTANNNWPSKIYRIDVGGSPAIEYGDIPLPDPDAVVFDSVGTISGQPGSVLVGGIDGPNSPTGYLAAILPDESTITIFGPGFGLVNPADMLFDTGGRLLIADAFAAKVFYSDDGVTLHTLIGNVYLAGELALDENGNIYLSRHGGVISKYSSDGTLLNGSFVTGLDIHGMDFGPSSPPWDGHLFAVSYEGKLYRIDEIGTVTEIGTGFHIPPGDPDLEFGPDGAMYVSDTGNYVIYRIVPENTPPEAICQDVTVSTDTGLCSADASIDDGSFDPDGDEITLEQTPPEPYNLGETEVTLTVTDDKGASDTCDATVTVEDQEAPVISSVTANPNKLWPPNHKMVPVIVAADASDNCDFACEIISVASNEPVNGQGDGNIAPDWVITGDLTVKLRAERSGKGNGRIYTITVECADSSGNSSTDTATVTVPHDKGKNNNKNKKK